MTETTAVDRPNEHPQASIDAFNLALIRFAQDSVNKKQGELRTAYSTSQLRGTDPDAAKIALKLKKGGREAIDAYFQQIRKVGEYLGALGAVLEPIQYEMFGPKVGPIPEDERAKLEGRAAGMDLDPEMIEQKNPYDPGTIKGQCWLSSFRQARTERDSIMAMQPPADPKGSASANADDDEEDE